VPRATRTVVAKPMEVTEMVVAKPMEVTEMMEKG